MSTAMELNLQSWIYTAVNTSLGSCCIHCHSPRVAVYINAPSFPAERIDQSQPLVQAVHAYAMPDVSKLWNRDKKYIRSAVRNIRPGVRIFPARVQHSEVGSRFRGRLRKFQPGAEYMEAGLENLEPGSLTGVWNSEPGRETFATDGTAYGRWQNGLAAQWSAPGYLLTFVIV